MKNIEDEEQELSVEKNGKRTWKIIIIVSMLSCLIWFLYQVLVPQFKAAVLFKTAVEEIIVVKGDRLKDILYEITKDGIGQKVIKAVAAPQQSLMMSEAVKISDICAEEGRIVQLKCYYPEAESYLWEIYNVRTALWETQDVDSVELRQDELYRPLSVLSVTAEGTEDIAVRCTVLMKDGGTETDDASIRIIPDIKDIKAEQYATDAGRYISSGEVPIHVFYADDTDEVITNLYGVSFIESQEEREISVNETGNTVETITTVNTECEYCYIGAEEKGFLLRYRADKQNIDTTISIIGQDLSAPVISDVAVGDFTITNVDAPVAVRISISAEDDKTPYHKLRYAFLPKDGENGTKPEPGEEDWTTEPNFDKEITQNGTWIAFCIDESGNVATMEKEIIVVDQKAPVISVSLENTEWCSSNKLLVSAKDYLPVEYRFISEGEDSGWTSRSEHEVIRNGTWEIQVRDSVGNISTETITVSNIDSQKPVIQSITIAEGGSDEN